MPSSFDLLQSGERLRVGQAFLRLRPRITALGALGNALLLVTSSAPSTQKLVLGAALVGTVGAFFGEARWLARHALSERWLLTSLLSTVAALSLAALFSGGLASPLLPLLFAPVVVGYAAFARRGQSWLLFAQAAACLTVLAAAAPLQEFPELPRSAHRGMLLVSSAMSFLLLAVGVTGLVDAHSRLARSLDRFRGDMLQEAERRALSVEHWGAQVAHEVKNPLTAARGLVQLVERHTSDERDQQRLNVAVNEVDRALSVLQDYLNFARPLTDLNLSLVDLGALLGDVALVLEARVREKSVRLSISAGDLAIRADRQRLRDALVNLALNAVTASPHAGELNLCASRSGSHAVLVVADEGPGISDQRRERMGQPFSSGSPGGTGLGVMLAESVARQHGGRLRYETAPRGGTRAILELPLDLEAEPT